MKESFSVFYMNCQTYSKLYNTSKVKCFAKKVNRQKQLSVFTKRSILDVCQDSEYATDCAIKTFNLLNFHIELT